MPFTGVVKAPELIPNPYGLLSVAKVHNHTTSEDGERWIRGFDQEDESNPTIRLLTKNDEAVSDQPLASQTGTARYQRVIPFFIETEDYISMFGVLGEDRFARVLRQLEAATQKALEKELWDGVATRGDTGTNPTVYLTKTGGATIISDTNNVKADLCLAKLEQGIASSPCGERAVIHMTRDVASILGSRLVMVDDQIQTRLGTPVVLGSGYTGNGPIGNANATANTNHKWMYATGGIEVHLGKSEVINESLAQGAAASTNDMRIKATRAAGIYFDTSIFQAIRVDITA